MENYKLSSKYQFQHQLGHIIFLEIGHEIISRSIFSLPLIQGGHYVYWWKYVLVNC